MRAPAFWDEETPDWRARLLQPAAAIYSAVAIRRFRRAPEMRANMPVLCIGNPTVGGTGKTPAAIMLAEHLVARGRRPVFLSRGYGARVHSPVVVDRQMHDAAAVGDEPLLLGRHALTVVSPDRAAGARRADGLGDVLVMDDGFQNPSLAKDLSILVVDARFGIGNGLPLPAGPLRLPIEAQLQSAQSLLLVGSGERGQEVEHAANRHGLTVLRGLLEPDRNVAGALAGRAVVAFAGIGRPPKFFGTLSVLGARLVATRGFPDHHRFSDREAGELLALAEARDAVLVTTEKDAARLAGAGGKALRRLAKEVHVLPVSLILDEPSQTALEGLIEAALARFSASGGPS